MHGRASNYRNIKAVNLTLLGRTHARTQQVPEAYIHDIQVEQEWNAIRTNAKFDQIVASQIFPRNQLLKMDLMFRSAYVKSAFKALKWTISRKF